MTIAINSHPPDAIVAIVPMIELSRHMGESLRKPKPDWIINIVAEISENNTLCNKTLL